MVLSSPVLYLFLLSCIIKDVEPSSNKIESLEPKSFNLSSADSKNS